MRVVVRGLLGLAVLSAIVSCRLDMTGLRDRDASVMEIHVSGPDAASGAAGSGAAGSSQGGAGTSSLAGQTGVEPTGAAGSDAAGTSGAAGEVAGIAGATGEAGTGAAGTTAGAGEADAGAAGTGMAGAGEAGMGAAGMGAAGAGTAGIGAAGMPPEISKVGCADETREGFVTLAKYPAIAACSGAWQIPGLVAANTYEPHCQRHPGNDGAGCSVADLCAEGWHVCVSVAEVKERAASCTDAFAPSGGTGVFFATRQRGTGSGTVKCEPQGDGTNNIYGCGNLGSTADVSCRPFTTMMRDADCMNNAPWSCVEGPVNYSVVELVGVKKPGNARGGVLCCR